jgi:hypothetical protein
MVWYLKTKNSKALEKIKLFEDTFPRDLFTNIEFVMIELEEKFLNMGKTVEVERPVALPNVMRQKALTIKT